jgi:lysophospholipase L1-like esterase
VSPVASNRSLLWVGLALVAVSPLLDAGALLPWVSGRALSETPITLIAERLVQALAFTGGIVVLRARRPGADPFPLGTLCASSAALVGMQGAMLLFAASSSVLEVLWAGTAAGLFLVTLRGAASLLAGALGFRWRVPGATGPLVAVAAFTLTAALLEGLLSGLARLPPTPAATADAPRLVMPESLQRREAQVAGAAEAYWWQGQLHVLDANRLRRTTPLPPKTPGSFRIAAFGDSLTYGEGVAAEEAWPAVLERELQRECRVEVLNLGVPGAQSEDVRRLAERLLPALDADLVLYGVCLNDFLPSGHGQYRNNRAWAVHLPYGYHLEYGTRLGGLTAAAYDRLLMRVGVRTDFATDILRDFRNYQRRFADDTAGLNRFVTASGLPPVTALVLNQAPRATGQARQIGLLAEQHLRAAGMTVVAADYLRVHSGRDFSVSRWEGHPNAEAHRIFAGEFLAAVRRDPRLAACRREADPPPN